MSTRHLRLVHSTRQPIAISDPTLDGLHINAVAHAEYRERRNPVDVPLDGPIVGSEPVLPLWAIGFLAFFIAFFGGHYLLGALS